MLSTSKSFNKEKLIRYRKLTFNFIFWWFLTQFTQVTILLIKKLFLWIFFWQKSTIGNSVLQKWGHANLHTVYIIHTEPNQSKRVSEWSKLRHHGLNLKSILAKNISESSRQIWTRLNKICLKWRLRKFVQVWELHLLGKWAATRPSSNLKKIPMQHRHLQIIWLVQSLFKIGIL